VNLPLPIEVWAQRNPRRRWPLVLAALVLLIGLAGGITGCGGGDADEADARADTQPVDCKLHPELCK
jgi:hypothetical protein